jgi:hypothetical protein
MDNAGHKTWGAHAAYTSAMPIMRDQRILYIGQTMEHMRHDVCPLPQISAGKCMFSLQLSLMAGACSKHFFNSQPTMV